MHSLIASCTRLRPHRFASKRTLFEHARYPYDVSEGVFPVMSPTSAIRHTVWVDNQIDKLNSLIVGTADENLPLLNLLLKHHNSKILDYFHSNP